MNLFRQKSKDKNRKFLLKTFCILLSLVIHYTSFCQNDTTKNHSLNDLVVKATRATEKSGMAFTNVYKTALNRQNFGQDLPFLLNMLPSVTITSDAGAGIGYTGIRIRGTDATRLNVTINGMPYNDAESQGTYFVDMPDIASSISSIQVQRGVGTSTNGAGAFGGSLNINTMAYEKTAYGEVNTSYGSFNSFKVNTLASTGLINKHFVLDLRLSKIGSDGFIDRATSNLKSYYVSGGYYTDKDFIRLNVFSGQERTYQAWNGIPKSRLGGDVVGMKDYIDRNGLSDDEAKNLLNSGNRTYNYFTYKDQVDNYTQTHYQLVSSFNLGQSWRFNPMLHYTKGLGYYEEYKAGQNLANYGLANVAKTDLVRRKWLDNDFYGVVYSLDYQPTNAKISGTIGGAWNKYLGGHFGEIIWLKNTALTSPFRWYDNNATKTDFTLYTKAYYDLTATLNTFIDLQIRSINYNMNGTEKNLQKISQSADYIFFTPKFGLNYKTKNGNIYVSYSIGKKEPSRQDFVDNFSNVPRPETLKDIELGYRYTKNNMVLGINLYNMAYIDQLIMTGKVNDVGEAIRANVPDSYRRGVELEAAYQLSKQFKVGANATFSQNKISNFVELIPNYDGDADKVNTYTNTTIAYSPSLISATQLSYTPSNNLELTWLTKYVGKQYLDNTTNESRKLNDYLTNDLRISYTIKQKTFNNLTINLLVNNIFNTLYESNGYTYSYIYDKSILTENFYYPQAGANFMAAIKVRF